MEDVERLLFYEVEKTVIRSSMYVPNTILEGNIKTELREDWGCSPHAVYFEDLKNLIMNYVKAFMEDAVFQQEVIESINEESSSTNYESIHKKP